MAIAVERFRLANEVLPENLDSLVPEYLPEVPRDLFSPRNDPIQFVPGDDFAYIVYSFGLDHEDGGGREDDESAQEGDIVFVVTSLATRLGPHILPAEASSTAD